MPFVPFPTGAMFELVYSWAGQTVENTLYFHRVEGTWDVDALNSTAELLFDWWDSNLKTLQSNTCRLQEIKGTNLASDESFSITRPVTASEGTGTASGAALPNNVSLCVSFRTAGRGRSNRGRNYTVGMVENHVVGNIATGFYAGAIQDAYNLLLELDPALDSTWSVASRISNGDWRPVGQLGPIIAALVVDFVVDSQRRRLPGRGS